MNDNLPANDLPEPVAELLRAVVEALDLPLPGIEPADERAHQRLLADRARHARITLAGVLRGHDPAGAAAWLRGVTAATPVTYRAWQPTEDQQQDGGDR